MRLTCPNCDAHYEVDGSMIPVEGRDVQCSNCGKTWFQPHEGEETAILSALTPASEPSPAVHETETIDAPESPEIAQSAEEPVVDDTSDWDEEDDFYDEDDDYGDEYDEEGTDASEEPAPSPSNIDDNILGILREEAAREINARRAEGSSGLETQPDLGLAGEASEDAVRARTSRLRGGDLGTAAGVAAQTDPGSRSDLLPDIDEINSTLSADETGVADDTEMLPESVGRTHRRGFRFGFSLILMLIAFLVLLYLVAPALGEAMPSMKSFLASYVDVGNGVRVWIDGLMGSAIDGLSGLMGDAG